MACKQVVQEEPNFRKCAALTFTVLAQRQARLKRVGSISMLSYRRNYPPHPNPQLIILNEVKRWVQLGAKTSYYYYYYYYYDYYHHSYHPTTSISSAGFLQGIASHVNSLAHLPGFPGLLMAKSCVRARAGFRV